MTSSTRLNPKAAASIAKWHEMVKSGKFEGLREISHPQVIFRSPVAFNPYQSPDALILAISNVFQVFKNFEYHRQLVTDNGLSLVLEFSTDVGDKSVKGIDLIRFDEDGLITEFEVMVRPLSGLLVLAEEMGKRLAGELPKFKAAQ